MQTMLDAVLPSPASPPPLAASDSGALRDAQGRVKRKLRLSLTDRCNLRCLYCMPEHPRWLPRDALLRCEELRRLAGLFVRELGIAEIRLTGGEPLLRKDAVEIVAALDTLRADGLERLAMTSNGVLLAEQAVALKAAGLDDLNISLDAIDPVRFEALTRGRIEPVLRGIEAARAAGLAVKINAVVIRGYNEMEVLLLARWAVAENLPLRFIEFMPLDGRGGWRADRVMREDDIIAALQPHFAIERLPRTAAPATEYRLDGCASLGVISTISKPFCSRCDRVRVTATGQLYACLFSAEGEDLRAPLRAGADDDALLRAVRHRVWHKGAGYVAQPGYVERPITMHGLGG